MPDRPLPCNRTVRTGLTEPWALSLLILLCLHGAAGHAAAALPTQESGTASKQHIGSAMAVLATLAQAQVLPPEQTPEANQIIKAVIQFQAAFVKSGDQAIQEFAAAAVTEKYGVQAPALLTAFRASGWTAPVLEALADAEPRVDGEQDRALAAGFSRFNVSTSDFHRFMGLVRAARQALQSRGLAFEDVYATHRRTMPGAPREDHGKPSDGQL
jgi:hypothetical protein